MVGVSRKTLSDIEHDCGNYKTDILDKVLQPVGLKVGLVPVYLRTLESLMGKG